MDAVEEYDSASSKIRQKYQEAMFGLAANKFTDPNSLNLTAHKCLPAFLKLTSKNQLEHGYSAFANKVAEEDIDGEEYEDQDEIEEKCA